MDWFKMIILGVIWGSLVSIFGWTWGLIASYLVIIADVV